MKCTQLLARRCFLLLGLLGGGLLPLAAQDFQVLKAEYGAGMNWTDVTEKVQGLVRGNGVQFRVDGETLGDPMPGVQKTLRVRYSFRNRVRTENFKDLENVRLGNPGGGGLPGGGFGRGLQIESARYGVGNRWNDVTALLQNSIQNDGLRMQVTNATMGGDPAPANEKVLEVRYRYQGRSESVTIRENQPVELGAMGGGGNVGGGGGGNVGAGLRILSARYGDGFRTTDVTQFLNNNVSNGRLRVQVNAGSMGGDPAPGVVKTLQVQYELDGRRNTMSVRDGEMLEIGGGFGGGNNGGWGGGRRLEILSATYGTFRQSVDVTQIVRDAQRNDGVRLVVNDFTMKANPSGGRNDRLVVRYVYEGQERSKEAGERETLILP